MIKLRTLGEIDRVVNNPVLKSANAVAQYTFLTDDGEVYLIANSIAGDNAYIDDVTIPAGEFLNGFLVRSLETQELVVDEKHITYGTGKSYDDLKVADPTATPAVAATLLTIGNDGKLAVAASAPESGLYFKVTDKCRLTGNAVVLKVMLA